MVLFGNFKHCDIHHNRSL